MLDGDHQQCSGRRATTYCPGETGPNPYSGSGVPHQTKPDPRETATTEESDDGKPRRRSKGASADRRNQERPEGSNAPSRSERQNISLPTLMDTAPPIVTEMQAMKE